MVKKLECSEVIVRAPKSCVLVGVADNGRGPIFHPLCWLESGMETQSCLGRWLYGPTAPHPKTHISWGPSHYNRCEHFSLFSTNVGPKSGALNNNLSLSSTSGPKLGRGVHHISCISSHSMHFIKSDDFGAQLARSKNNHKPMILEPS